MKVLHIAPAAGSLAVLLRGRMGRMRDRGFEQVAFSTSRELDEDPRLALEAVGVDYRESVHLTRDFDVAADIRFGIEVARLVREVRPDVTMTYGPKPGAIARPLARIAGSRVVHTHWGNVFDESSSRGKKVIYRSIDRVGGYFSSDVFVTNHGDLDRLDSWKNPTTAFHYLGNATDVHGDFDPDSIDPAARDRLRSSLGVGSKVLVTLVGRVVVDKGYREYIAAVTELFASRPDLPVVFAFVGRRDEARGLGYDFEGAEELLAAGRLVDIGSVSHDEMPLIYRSSDVVCLPSYREGFPRSLVEASSMGCALVATDIAGCREAVVPDTNGLLVRVKDVESLRAALERVVDDDELRARLRQGARELAVERFSEDALVARVSAVLHQGAS